MGYHQKIIITISEVGWDQVELAYANADAAGKMSINEVLAEADEHIVSDDGDHLISLDWVKSTWSDLISFKSLIDAHSDEYYWVAMGEDGAEEFLGGYQDNPFQVTTMHEVAYDDSFPTVKFGGFSAMAGGVAVSNAVKTITAINLPLSNDHTCIHCGNNRCSKQEKTCWKCGMGI